jgi:predicted RNA-binding protein with PIN domain
MPLLLDTYNILHVTGVLPPEVAGIDVAGLIDLLAGSRYRAEHVVLVCDGNPHRGGPRFEPSAQHRVVFSGKKESADDVIVRMIGHSSAPRRLTVVSSDNEILRAARKRRCPTMSSEKFLEALAEDSTAPRARSASSSAHGRKPRAPLSAASVEEWIKVFGLDEKDLRIESSDPDLRRTRRRGFLDS